MRLLPEIVTASAASIRRDGGHLFWKKNEPLGLAESLAAHGQLSPVLAEETDQGLNLLAGHARVAVLAELGRPVLVRLVEGADDPGRGFLYLADNGQRVADDAMRLAALEYFVRFLDRAGLEAEVLPRLGVRAGSKECGQLLAWLDLPEDWRTHLAAGRAPLDAGAILARMDGDSQAALAPFFARLSWTRSHGVNFLTWLYEASRREGVSVASLVAGHKLAHALDLELSPKDAVNKLAGLAHRIHRPTLARLEARYIETARGLTTGTAWKIEEPSNFETGGAKLSVSLRTPAQLRKALADLERMAGSSAWDALWNPGTDDHE